MADHGGWLQPGFTRVVVGEHGPEHVTPTDPAWRVHVGPPGAVEFTPNQEDDMAKDPAEEQTTPEAPPPPAGNARVIYGGPNGHFLDGSLDMARDGDPVEISRERLEQLRAAFPDHSFEEAP